MKSWLAGPSPLDHPLPERKRCKAISPTPKDATPPTAYGIGLPEMSSAAVSPKRPSAHEANARSREATSAVP